MQVSGMTRPWFSVDSDQWFSVRWENDLYPLVSANCSSVAGCRVHSTECICDIHVATQAVFTDVSKPPTLAQIESQLRIGSASPSMYDSGDYAACTTTPCLQLKQAGGVDIYLHKDSQGSLDRKTIFSYLANGTKRMYLRNKLSMVTIPGTSSKFRNPARFNKFGDQYLEVTNRDAWYETEDLLQHLFWHQNTAPFISYRMVQRLATSNPSPRYIYSVAKAFRTGRFGGRSYSGLYGDMGAMAAAIILDREARSITLDGDPTHGQLREPHLKVLHLLRSLEFVPRDDREVDLDNMDDKIGMEPKNSDTVFNFYKPEFVPEGVIGETGLVSPEATLATGPAMIGLLNGASALINDGLYRCDAGFGSGSHCPSCCTYAGGRYRAYGWLSYSFGNDTKPTLDDSRGSEPAGLGTRAEPGDLLGMCQGDCDADWECGDGMYCFQRSGFTEVPGCSGQGKQNWDYCTFERKPTEGHRMIYGSGTATDTRGLVTDLSLLLTAGRLSPESRQVVETAYDARLAESGGSTPEALRVAEQLVMIAPEFHATNAPQHTEATRPPPADKPPPTRPYKAIVMVFLGGGMDSFNLVVPLAQCRAANGQPKDCESSSITLVTPRCYPPCSLAVMPLPPHPGRSWVCVSCIRFA